MVWFVKCYKREECNNFHIEDPEDEYGNLQYDCDSYKHRYKEVIPGAQLMTPFSVMIVCSELSSRKIQ